MTADRLTMQSANSFSTLAAWRHCLCV